MVRVWYEPPPHGPFTDLARSPYGMGSEPGRAMWLRKLARLPPWVSVPPIVLVSLILCTIPTLNPKLPHTFSPEYKAAERAYMRYHNMEPIFGVSSKKARERDGEL